jgi:mxaK protein
MKRRHIHLAFALGSVLFGALTAFEAVQLARAHRVNHAILNADTEELDTSMPRARFAHAATLAKSGNYDPAVSAYKELVQGDDEGLKRAALFNLGNMHLHEALSHGPQDETRWLPMIEFAKQSYRNLLREDPAAWDARYNLEYALRLAPELEESASTEQGPPPDSERTTSTISSSRMDLP